MYGIERCSEEKKMNRGLSTNVAFEKLGFEKLVKRRRATSSRKHICATGFKEVVSRSNVFLIL